MTRSLGLRAYRALARHKDVPQDAPNQPRPTGELVWIHAGEPENLLAVQDLALRLVSVREGLSVMITLPETERSTRQLRARSDNALIQTTAPGEHPAAIRAFLDHWQPDACVWVWGGLRPNLVMETAERRCPMFLIDADTQGFDARRDRWLPDLTRSLLERFTAIFARSTAGQRRLLQLGLQNDKVVTTSALLAGGHVLACEDRELDDLSASMGGRPAWFASGVLDKEIPVVLAAHKQALRFSHRLLLILQPDQADQSNDITALAAERDLTTLQWGNEQFPDDTTQLLITDDPEDRGLFFRVAPVSFLGGTLVHADASCDPLEAAALGSAILYGPRVRHFLPSYTRLAAAGAARIVNDAGALGTAVSRLIAPDQAATMAHAGWDVVSQGAALTDRVVELIQDALDVGISRS